jgi:hypothetical protein
MFGVGFGRFIMAIALLKHWAQHTAESFMRLASANCIGTKGIDFIPKTCEPQVNLCL